MTLSPLVIVQVLNIAAAVAFVHFLRQVVGIFEAQVEAAGGFDKATRLVADFHGSNGNLFNTLRDCVRSVGFLVD